MSLSRTLQKQVLGLSRDTDRAVLRREVLACGDQWYRDNPLEREAVRGNLQLFGLDSSDTAVDAVLRHVMLHYYEKLIPLYGTPQAYAAYLRQRVDARDAAGRIGEVIHGGQACLLAVCHFGAVELVTPTLAMHGLPVTAALRFTTPQLSEAAARQAQLFHQSGLFEQVRFIEVGKPGVSAALEMAAAVRRRGILLSVFDEKTDYSIPVDLLGRRVWGGAGLDRLVRFAGAPYRLCAVFMARTGEETYRLDLAEVPPESPAPIQSLFDSLALMVTAHPEQWYFLHEELPLVGQDETGRDSGVRGRPQ